MPVLMAVRLGAIPVEIVRVLVMRVVNVWMGVFERLMRVRVFVTLGQQYIQKRFAEAFLNVACGLQRASVLTS